MMVRHKAFQLGDLVCRKLEATRSGEGQGKLALDWEDLIRVREDLNNGVYKVETLDGELILRT